jgi:hypothetical protein
VNWLDEVWETISEYAGSGSATTGEASEIVINAGLNIAALAQLLQNIAASAEATPAEVHRAQQELAYLQTTYYAPQEKSVILPLLLVGGLIYAVTRD